MTNLIEGPCCIQDCKIKPTSICLGCPKLTYCKSHHMQHRHDLSTELEKLIHDYNTLSKDIQTQQSNTKMCQLIKAIDEWESNSIEKIKRLAATNRQNLLRCIDEFTPRVQSKLNSSIDTIRRSHEADEFVDTDLKQWMKEFQNLRETLNNLPNYTIYHAPMPFISNIRVEISHIPYIPAITQRLKSDQIVAGDHGTGNSLNQLENPRGICVDVQQTVIIADCANNRIIQWKKPYMNGEVVAGGHGLGTQLNKLHGPTDVLIDTEGNSLIVCDNGNRRVVRWSLHTGKTRGEIIIDNIDCYGIAKDDQGNLYVSDIEQHQVLQYQIGKKEGVLVAGGHGKGANLNQLNVPTHIFVDQQENVYVSDSKNHRVIKWNKGATRGIVVAGGQGDGNNLTQLSYPEGLFVDKSGALYVADMGNHRIMQWPQEAKQGTIIYGGHGSGQDANQLKSPMGLSFDHYGNIYVGNYWKHRVQKLSIE